MSSISNTGSTDLTTGVAFCKYGINNNTKILVLLMYLVLHITMHGHTIIITETFVNLSVGSCRPSSDRAVNANGD